MSIEEVSRAKLIVGFHRNQGCMPRSAPTLGKFSILPWPENTPSLTVVLPCPAPRILLPAPPRPTPKTFSSLGIPIKSCPGWTELCCAMLSSFSSRDLVQVWSKLLDHRSHLISRPVIPGTTPASTRSPITWLSSQLGLGFGLSIQYLGLL